MDTNKLEEIALQLREPKGLKGLEMADMMNETNINMTLHAIHHLEVRDNDIIMELGHGNAKHVPKLLQQSSNLSYQGLETSALMHKEAQHANNQYSPEEVSFQLYDGLHIPFADATFNKIFTVNTLYFWTDPQFLLSELYRVLKHKGLLIITFAQQEFMEKLPFTKFGFTLYDNEKLKHCIDSTNFKIKKIDSLTELVRSKTNDLVEREYTSFVLIK